MLFIDALCVVGHKPDKLWGYDIAEPHYDVLKEIVKSVITSYGIKRVYVGMELGAGQLCAQACVDLKLTGLQLELIAAIPCQNHSCKWPESAQNYYNYLLAMCDQKILVSDAPYNTYLMQVRNQYIIDNSDATLAIWDGYADETADCVEYTAGKLKPIIRLEPKKIIVQPVFDAGILNEKVFVTED